jgi:hypothetical protein
VIPLDEAIIERALPLVSIGLKKYLHIQELLTTTDLSTDRTFQTAFNAFYRVRRDSAWQSAFYALFQGEKSSQRPFAEVLQELHRITGRVEGSFASKLVASIDPSKPVIDSFVLKNLGLRKPLYGEAETKLTAVSQLYDRINREYLAFLSSDLGRRLGTMFVESYPDSRVTPVKMLDLILWQTR